MLGSVQSLRYFAALFVVFLHTFNPVRGILARDHEVFLNFLKLGAVGVHIFFVISGFVMVWAHSKDFGSANPVLFIKRRLFRIFPIYWILALINIPVLYWNGRSLPESVIDWVGAFTLWPGYSSSLIFVGWTLSFELLFYGIFGIAIAFQFDIKKTLIILTGVFSLLIALGVLFDPSNKALDVATDSLLLEFIFGTWIAYLFLNGLKFPTWIALVLLGLGVFGLLGSSIIGYDVWPSVILWGIPSSIILIAVIQLERNGHGSLLFKKTLELGSASYSMYLIHPIIIFVAAHFLVKPQSIGFGTLMATMIVSGVICSYASLLVHRKIERPVARKLKHLFLSSQQAKV